MVAEHRTVLDDIGTDPRRQTAQLVDLAADVAAYFLHDDPERLRHSAGVAERATFLTLAVADEEAPLLVAAGWLHDIGYAPALKRTGFHPLDGALALRDMGWPEEVCGLVAHHSGSRFVAAARGLGADLDGFAWQLSPLSDAVTVADQTAGPNGVVMTVQHRIADMLSRHGSDSPNARTHPQRGPYLLTAAGRLAERLEHQGITPEQHGIFTDRRPDPGP